MERNSKNKLVLIAAMAAAVTLCFSFETQAEAKNSKSSAAVMETDQVEQFMSFIKEKAANGELETEEDIKSAIAEGEDNFGLILTDAQKEKIVKLAGKLKGMGMDSDFLVAQAEKLYDEYGAQLVESAEAKVGDAVDEAVAGAEEKVEEALSEMVETAANSFWKDVKSALKGLYDSIFS